MHATRKTNEGKVRTKKSTQDDLSNSAQKDEKPKKSIYSVSTPRSYMQKSTTADIYARKNNSHGTNAPKKISAAATPRLSNVSPMKDLLKSSPSTSQMSARSVRNKMVDLKTKQTKALFVSDPKSARRNVSLTNVTVNSPVVRKRLNLDSKSDSVKKNEGGGKRENGAKEPVVRQRTKTRTLEDDEVKILTPEAIDNNAAMQDLTRKLAAKPKAFYVDLEEEKAKKLKVKESEKQMDKSSEEEVSYEDDFESYESDFESYHSEAGSGKTSAPSDTSNEDRDDEQDDGENREDGGEVDKDGVDKETSKDVKDEERMLDSGNFDLRDSQRSANKAKPVVMDFILESAEDGTEDKKISLTDEGFQEMSSSSVSSMKVVHTDVLERPLFIDFKKSKANKRKRRIFERLKQRADDILSMITLHEMSYTLFEMKPIPYEVYMATFGRKNCTQTAVQTFEDGITQEVQTDYIMCSNKWTQFPVEFSKSDIHIDDKFDNNTKMRNEEFVFEFLNQDGHDRNEAVTEEYKMNPLRIYFEQKDGAGSDAMLPEEVYKSKLKNSDFNVNGLRKFLKKTETRISNILSINAGNSDSLNLIKTSKFPFSKGYVPLLTSNLTNEKLSFLKYTKAIGAAISDLKDNLVMTFHIKSSTDVAIKCVICLWDTNVARREPLKVLKATDKIVIGRYRGSIDGIFVGALEDGSIHLWDLSEEPTWSSDVASLTDEKATKLVDVSTSNMSQIETDREWNLKNSHVSYEKKPQCSMQVSAYTSSAVNMQNKEAVDSIVGLEFIGPASETVHQDGGRKIVGQICALQRLGILTIWSILQEKPKFQSHDIGKAYWSKMKLEKYQSINLSEHLDVPTTDLDNIFSNFNLNAAKRRLSNQRQERTERKKEISRPKSAISNVFDRSSVASPRRNLPISSNLKDPWDSGIICNHLKVLRFNKIDSYLIANSNGEVLCCKRNVKAVQINRLLVASDRSPITRLEITNSNLPHFLAATASGTVNLCSIVDSRVLLTLDCRNGPPTSMERCQADHKGRFISTVNIQSTTESIASRFSSNWHINCLIWSQTNPLLIGALLPGGALCAWRLTRSDIHADSVAEVAAIECIAGGNCVALVTEGEVQIHRLSSEQHDDSTLELFQKYVSLL